MGVAAARSGFSYSATSALDSLLFNGVTSFLLSAAPLLLLFGPLAAFLGAFAAGFGAAGLTPGFLGPVPAFFDAIRGGLRGRDRAGVVFLKVLVQPGWHNPLLCTRCNLLAVFSQYAVLFCGRLAEMPSYYK